MLPMRFQAILRRKPFSRSRSRTQISRPSRERSFSNFHPQPLPIFVIWPKYATSTILRDSETATFFAQAIPHANNPDLLGALLL